MFCGGEEARLFEWASHAIFIMPGMVPDMRAAATASASRHCKPRHGRVCNAPGLSLPPLGKLHPRCAKNMTLKLLFKAPASPLQRLFF